MTWELSTSTDSWPAGGLGGLGSLAGGMKAPKMMRHSETSPGDAIRAARKKLRKAKKKDKKRRH